jgi:ABC-type dipeptide/oligopeptide/nickel transport system permease component
MSRGTWKDPTLTTTLLVLSALPVVLVIPSLQIIFGVKLHWFPVAGWHGLFSRAVVLPTIALTYAGIAGIARLTRISMLQVIDEEFVRTARAKGLDERVVVLRHVLRNAFLPLLNAILYSIFFLVIGDFFVELLFGIPGVAKEALDTISSRDYDELMALTLFSAFIFIIANIVLDIMYGIVDPRIRIGSQS